MSNIINYKNFKKNDNLIVRDNQIRKVTVYDCSITYLIDSKENFPEWIKALKSAKKYICIEMYNFASNDIGILIKKELLNKLKEGIEVFIICDMVGSFISHLKLFFRDLSSSGAKVIFYNKIKNMLSRDHRKCIIVDGKIAFVGGLCISSTWEGNPKKGIAPWRDTGVKLEGSVVNGVLRSFIDSWKAITRDDIGSILVAQTDDLKKSAKAIVIESKKSSSNMIREDLMAIESAKKNVWITDAYFMPTSIYIQSLVRASLDNVDVRLLVPRTSDIKWIGTISRTQYRKLLEAGVRIFEWNGSMIHAKTSIIDDNWARVGSTNLNISSFFNNRELDIVLQDKKSVSDLKNIFLKDLNNSTEVVLDKNKSVFLKDDRSKLHPKERIKIYGRGVARQAAYIQSALVKVTEKQTLDTPELIAYSSISIFLLLLILLIFFLPKILIYPILLLLIIIFVVNLLHIFSLFKLKIKNNKNKK